MKINKEVTSKKIANCTEILEYINFGKVLYKINTNGEAK